MRGLAALVAGLTVGAPVEIPRALRGSLMLMWRVSVEVESMERVMAPECSKRKNCSSDSAETTGFGGAFLVAVFRGAFALVAVMDSFCAGLVLDFLVVLLAVEVVARDERFSGWAQRS